MPKNEQNKKESKLNLKKVNDHKYIKNDEKNKKDLNNKELNQIASNDGIIGKKKKIIIQLEQINLKI